MMTIFYKVHNNLYVNLTNRCPCSCTFCLRQTMDKVGESDSLWLDHEPDWEEILQALKEVDMDEYEEVVFCGFGEPTEALPMLLKLAAYLKEHYDKPIRLNTNGLANRIHPQDVPPLLEGLIDTISISLNTPDPEAYYKLVRPKFGPDSWQAMIDFAKESTRYVPNVVLSTVSTTLTEEEEEKCAQICRSIGVTYRIRPWEGGEK